MSEYDSMHHELNWDDEIQRDDAYQVLPEGDYHFTVKKFERARHSGSEKIPSCNKAVLTVAVSSGDASGEVQTNLFLHSKFEWKLCQFFTSIGQRRHGEAMRMNWGAVPGATGVCHMGVRKWTGNDGKERESNEIAEFYDPETAPEIPTGQEQAVQETAAGWTELPQRTPTPWDTGKF